MSEPAPPRWAAWAPPLDPPVSGGLPVAEAERIAAQWGDDDPHCLAADLWDAYAGMLDPTPSIASVSTGAQSVSYAPAGPSGAFGLAVARANWHRSFCAGMLQTPEVGATPAHPVPVRGEPDWREWE